MNDQNNRTTDIASSQGAGSGASGSVSSIFSGCLLVFLGAVLGVVGGVLAGVSAFDWYYAGEQVDPTLQISWAVRGGFAGLSAGFVVSLMGWGISMMAKQK